MGNSKSYVLIDDDLHNYLDYLCLNLFDDYTMILNNSDYIIKSDLLEKSKKYYEKMMEYQRGIPKSFSIIIDIDNPKNNTVNLNNCFVEIRKRVSIYKYYLVNKYLFDRYEYIDFYCPYKLALIILEKKYTTPYYEFRYDVNTIENDRVIEIFYDKENINKTTFKPNKEINRANLIEYYKKQLTELEQEEISPSNVLSPSAPEKEEYDSPPPYKPKE